MGHGLMDGFALFQLIAGDLGGVNLSQRGYGPRKSDWKSKIKTFLYHFVFLFKYPYDLHMMLEPGLLISPFNDFRKGYSDLSSEQIGSKPLPIPLKYIKDIRKSHNVAFGSVIIAAWAGGLRRAMLSQNMNIPKIMHWGFSLAMPGHPGLLRVHASVISIILPVGIKDPVERLHAIDHIVTRTKNSTNTEIIFMFKPFIGSIPTWLVSTNAIRVPPTGLMNVFLGITEPMFVFEQQATEVYFSYGQQATRNSILCSSVTYCDTVFAKVGVNANIYSQQSDVDKLNAFVLDELDFLSTHGTV